MATSDSSAWPPLPYAQWRDTCTTLHLWTQIVGKIRLQQTPWLNHGWHVPLYVTARGLTTSLIPYGERSFEMLFDFNDHALRIDVSDGARRQVALRARSVADFHAAVMQQLGDLDMPVTISDLPCEIGGAIPFSSDREHAAYDPEQARRFWRVLLQCDRVLKQFRTGFLGKSSPVHFFWGSFDLAVTRFSGRPAPAFSGNVPGVAATVMREAYSHEVSSAGFWPGGNGIDYPAFYSYAYPVPPDFHARPGTARRGVLQRRAGGIPVALRGGAHRIRPGLHAARVSAEHLRRRRRVRALGSGRARATDRDRGDLPRHRPLKGPRCPGLRARRPLTSSWTSLRRGANSCRQNPDRTRTDRRAGRAACSRR